MNFQFPSNILTAIFTILLGICGYTETAVCQIPLKRQTSTQDWRSRLPVSLNEKKTIQLNEYVTGTLKPSLTQNYWHDRMQWGLIGGQIRRGWDASKFFEDQLVVDLCKAIFDEDVPEMERLITAGADVNQIGKNGMTPLYWAFHVDNDPRPFGCLLKHGANPNIIARLQGRTEPQAVDSGYAVVHLVATGAYNRHFKTVFENGGDPNVKNDAAFSGLSPFWIISPAAPDAVERLELLIKHGADLESQDDKGKTLLYYGIRGSEIRRRLALVLLKAGADFRLYYSEKNCHFRLIHFLAEAKPTVDKRPMDERIHYYAVVDWLEKHGESMADAQTDLARWDKWKANGQLDLIEKEHKERLAEKAAKKTSGGG